MFFNKVQDNSTCNEILSHMHIVGVPIKYKNGISKQLGKSNVFTKDRLKILQDKKIIFCIE